MAKIKTLEKRLAVLEEAAINAFGGDALRAALADCENEDGDEDEKGDE